MITSPAATKAGISHATLVTIALAVSLVAVCLFSGACFWLHRKHTRESRMTVNSQEQFDKVEPDIAVNSQEGFDKAELDSHEITVAKKQSFAAELSAQRTPRIPDLEPAELPATPLTIRPSWRKKRPSFF